MWQTNQFSTIRLTSSFQLHSVTFQNMCFHAQERQLAHTAVLQNTIKLYKICHDTISTQLRLSVTVLPFLQCLDCINSRGQWL